MIHDPVGTGEPPRARDTMTHTRMELIGGCMDGDLITVSPDHLRIGYRVVITDFQITPGLYGWLPAAGPSIRTTYVLHWHPQWGWNAIHHSLMEATA